MEEKKLLKRKRRADECGNIEQLAHYCRELGNYYRKVGKYNEALRQFKEEENINMALNRPVAVAISNRMVGEIYCDIGDFKEALIYQEKHLVIARKEKNEIEEQRALANLGRTYFCMAEAITKSERKEYDSYLSSAKKVYIQSLELSDSIQGIGHLVQMEMRARLLLNIGLVLECQGNLIEASKYMAKAVAIAQQGNLPEELFRCYSACGIFHHRQGDCDKALKALNLAMEAAERLEAREKHACEALLSKAEVLFSMADFEGAKQALLKAFRLRTPDTNERKSIEKNLKIAVKLCQTERKVLSTDSSEHKTLKSLYETLGDGVVAAGNFKKAIEYYLKMLECAEAAGDSGRTLCPIYVSLAQTYKDDCQYDLALKYSRKELEISEDTPQEACKTMLTISELLELKKAPYIEVAGSYLRAKEFAVQGQDWKLLVTTLRCLSSYQRNSSLEDLAEETEKECSDVIKQHNVRMSSDDEGESCEEEFGGSIDLDELAESDSDEEEVHGVDLHGVSDQADRRSRRRKVTCKGLAVQRNEKGETALHRACISGNITLVQRLIERGHPINVRDHCGWTPLHEACNHGHEEVVSLLLAGGALVNDRGGTHCGGFTPIHDAASCGHLSVVRMLLAAGALPTVRTDKGETPLDCLRQWYERVRGEVDSRVEEEFRQLEGEMSTSLEKRMGVGSGGGVVSRGWSGVHPPRGPSSSLGSAEEEEDNDCISSEGSGIEEDPMIPTRAKTAKTMSSSQQETGRVKGGRDLSASSDYARTIASLKNRQSLLSLSKDFKGGVSSQLSSGTEKSPLLAEEEDIVDDWLEDDLSMTRPPAKRTKKCLSVLGGRRGERSHKDSSLSSPQDSAALAAATNGRVEQEEEGGPLEERQGGQVEGGGEQAPHLLLRAVACEGQSSTPPPPAGPPPALRLPPSIQLVKVDVEGTLLLVPLDAASATFDCLAKEAARRYLEFKGVSVELTLHTPEGAMLSKNDPVTLLSSLGGNDPRPMVLVAHVTSLTLPPITESYEKACAGKHIDPSKEVSQSLELCQAIHALSLNDMCLGSKEFGVVMHVVLQHRNLAIRRLSLASNDIGDEGLKLLCQGLSAMQNMVTLDLSCNGITAIGLSDLASVFTKQSVHSSPLQALADLNLSHNPLGDAGFPHLGTILSSLLSLTTLSLRDCCLSACDGVHFNVSNSFNLDSLEHLDLSLNALGPEGVAMFLSSLQPAKLKVLNVSRTLGHSPGTRKIAREVALLLSRNKMNPPLNLIELDLSHTLVNDLDLYEVIRALEDSNLLERFGLDCNPDLTSLSLRRLLQQGKWPGLCVSLSGCPNIFDHMEESEGRGDWIQTRGASMLPSQITLSVGRRESEGAMRHLVGMWVRGSANALVERGQFGCLKLATRTTNVSPPLMSAL